MNAPPPIEHHPPGTIRFAGGEGLPFRLTLSWCLAAGLGIEVVVVATAVLTRSGGMISSDPVVPTLLFAVGAAVGFIHGALFSLAGRPRGVSAFAALRGIALAAFAFLALSIPAWGAALWISLTAPALASGDGGLILLSAAGWGAALTAGAWALLEMLEGMGHAFDRWPAHRLGLRLLFAIFCLFLLAFVRLRPEIWFTDLRVTALGAVHLAVGATIWLGVPTVVLGLRGLSFARRLDEAAPAPKDEHPSESTDDGREGDSRHPGRSGPAQKKSWGTAPWTFPSEPIASTDPAPGPVGDTMPT